MASELVRFNQFERSSKELIILFIIYIILHIEPSAGFWLTFELFELINGKLQFSASHCLVDAHLLLANCK